METMADGGMLVADASTTIYSGHGVAAFVTAENLAVHLESHMVVRTLADQQQLFECSTQTLKSEYFDLYTYDNTSIVRYVDCTKTIFS